MLKMKKILMIVTNGYGPDIRVHNEAKYLYSKGYNVNIISWDRENKYPSKTEVIDGILIKRYSPYAKYGTGLKQLKSYFLFIKSIRKDIKKSDYDYIHGHDLDGIIAAHFSNVHSKKIIFDMHEFYEGRGNKNKIKYIIRFLVKFFQKKSFKIIYLNDMQKSHMSKKSISKLIFLPNYPDIKDFNNPMKTVDESLRVSYIGSVRQYTELNNLIIAGSEIKNIKIYIHGDGTAYDKLLQNNYNFENVSITGKYIYTNSLKLYNNTDVLYAVYSTKSFQNRNAFPIKFYESILSCTPIIVSRGSVLEEVVIKHGIGYVVDGDNLNEISKLLEHIESNRAELMIKTANIKKIRHLYTWSRVVNNLDKIYL